MRKNVLRIVGLLLTLAALTTGTAKAVDPICPLCIIGYQCCIHGQQAQCIPATHPCN
jgi:hypothetical protein